MQDVYVFVDKTQNEDKDKKKHNTETKKGNMDPTKKKE
jgi:hypothetical protein